VLKYLAVSALLYKYMSKKTVAFIDVQNTDTTTKKLLGFEVDWKKLCHFLKNDWQCDKVFFYVGIDEGDLETTNLFEGLRGDGCIVRAKVVFAYKNKDLDRNVTCPKCSNKIIEKIDMGYNRKSNCDVDLTVDAMELGGVRFISGSFLKYFLLLNLWAKLQNS